MQCLVSIICYTMFGYALYNSITFYKSKHKIEADIQNYVQSIVLCGFLYTNMLYPVKIFFRT